MAGVLGRRAVRYRVVERPLELVDDDHSEEPELEEDRDMTSWSAQQGGLFYAGIPARTDEPRA
jgi:hypothetical protein